ncbi:MAG TPA: glycosyltransferase family 39 protein [Bryobacteraceae bacterium]
MSPLRRYFQLVTVIAAISALYLYKLNGVGVLGPDEPRYAAIGRSMAHSGDLITPNLWSTAWFEKPPLLYWMTALGAAAGLGPELSGRLPVALLSLSFLAVSFVLLKREFGLEASASATALLATSAGWIAFSSLCLTDLPLACFFSLAVFLSLPVLRKQADISRLTERFAGIGACMGLAVLAKGLVPIALALPLFWFLRRFLRKWWISLGVATAVAAPWYVAVYLRNGYPFIQEFFFKHHFERLYSASLQHVQPWYYYFPVLLAGIFPWTPLLGILFLRDTVWDERRRCLAAIVLFGLLVFSSSLNKLPGYLLPLLPSLFAMFGSQLESKRVTEFSRLWLIPCALLAACIPLLAKLLPFSLAQGRFSIPTLTTVSLTGLFYISTPIAAVVLAKRSWAAPLLVLCIVAGGFYLKITSEPILDREVSARSLWRDVKSESARLCDAGVNRDWLYGISFYRGALLPPCTADNADLMLRSERHGRPVLSRAK